MTSFFKPHLSRRASALYEVLDLFVVALFITAVLRSFVFQSFFIPSRSMVKTLEVGDRLVVSKLSYLLSEPEKGDVVVFGYPLNTRIDYIKRVVAVAGDTIDIRNNKVSVNGVQLNEPYINRPDSDVPLNKVFGEAASLKLETEVDTSILGNTVLNSITISSYMREHQPGETIEGPITVPEGYLFCLGDNRGASEDSRFWGFVPRQNLVGRARFIFWPPSRIGFIR